MGKGKPPAPSPLPPALGHVTIPAAALRPLPRGSPSHKLHCGFGRGPVSPPCLSPKLIIRGLLLSCVAEAFSV